MQKPIIKIIVTVFLLAGLIAAGYSVINNNIASEAEGVEKLIKEVKTAKIDLLSDTTSFIETVGTVKAEAQIDVTATTRGTIRGIYFNVGDEVNINKLLASLYDSSTLTNRNNAQTNFVNMQSNLLATERITNETVHQAEIGVQAAEESIKAAEIGLKTSKDNLASARALRDKSNINLKNNAIISFNGYLNTIFSTLDQVNYIIKAEGNIQLPNIEPVLGVKNSSSVNTAKTNYFITREAYTRLTELELTASNIAVNMKKMSETLSLTQNLVDNIIIVLDNTITDANFNSASLSAQKTAFSALRATVVNSETGALSTYQVLENLALVENQETTALQNAVNAAENQLQKTQTGYDNALIVLENAKQAKNQQVLASQSSLDNAEGQFNLAQVQAGDLNIKTPISGKITGKYIEVGAEVNPGQKIAQVSQTDNLKIEINLPSEEIYRISKGEEVVIGENLKGTISSIDPAADPITRKVKVEILYDNKNNDLIQGTFIDVVIPIKKLEKTHSESVFIPLRAVIIAPEGNYVFTVMAGDGAETKLAKKTTVITGKTEGALIEILDGLNTGDELIVEGGKNLEDGETLKIIE